MQIRIPLVRRRGDDTPRAWWEWSFAPILIPLALLGIALLAGLSILAMPFLALALRRREYKLTRAIRARDRFIPWNELEPRLQAGEGTLVVEQAMVEGLRVWWTDEDITQHAPMPTPSEKELDYHRFKKPHPFVSWCYDSYLSPESGRALLTNPPFSYPRRGVTEAAFFKARFPKMQVVMTVKSPDKVKTRWSHLPKIK